MSLQSPMPPCLWSKAAVGRAAESGLADALESKVLELDANV